MRLAGLATIVAAMFMLTTEAQSSELIFDRGKHQLTLLDKDGKTIGVWEAYNNVDSTAKGPFPNGTWLVDGNPRTHPDDAPDSAYGSHGSMDFIVPGRKHLAVHSGHANTPDKAKRRGPRYATNGCIRTTDEAMKAIVDLNKTDRVKQITVQDQEYTRVSTLASLAPPLNLRILYWGSQLMGEKVGDGQFWAAVPELLQRAGGEIPGVYQSARLDRPTDSLHARTLKAISTDAISQPDGFVSFVIDPQAERRNEKRDEPGAIVAPEEPAYPGDIVHFESAKFVQPDEIVYTTAEHHWAVIYEVHAHRTFTLIHQNWNGNQFLGLWKNLNFADLKKGTVTIHRPQRLPGRLTFDAEGIEGGRARSGKLQFRGNQFGVTVGRGYHMKGRIRADVFKDLKTAGLSELLAAQYSAGAGLIGPAALQFVRLYQDRLQEITPGQQKNLFLIDYVRQEKATSDQYVKYKPEEGSWKVTWDKMDSSIKEVLVDLQIRGDYTPEVRRQLEKLAAANDLEAFTNVLRDRSKWRIVPEDRFKRRIAFLEDALLVRRASPSVGLAAKPDSYVGKKVGEGHSTAFVQEAAALPPPLRWKRGIPVRGENLPKGIAIAAFPEESSRPDPPKAPENLHAAIYDGQDESGIWVYDQRPGNPVQRRHIRFQQGQMNLWEDGNSFKVVVLQIRTPEPGHK